MKKSVGTKSKQKKRIKLTVLLVCIMFIVAFASCVRASVFDSGAKDHLSGQYADCRVTVYPRGSITDTKGVAFTGRTGEPNKTPGLYLKAYSSEVAKNVVGQTELSEYSTTDTALSGVSGIEYLFDSVLNGGSPYKIYASVDANGDILSRYGFGVLSDHQNEGGSIMLTLDYNVQKAFEDECEKTLTELNVPGIAVVLTDVDSSEIIAMVSAGSEMNKAVLSYQPGSIMKILTAAAALEAGLVTTETEYNCTSAVLADTNEKHCDKGIKHGIITLTDAFAYSCNCYFYELGKKLLYLNDDGITNSKMLSLAQNFGFGVYPAAPNERFLLEYSGHFSFVPESVFNETDLFNVTLGQGNVQASPYTVNKITAAIAKAEAVITEPYIIKEVRDAAGNELSGAETKTLETGLSEKTLNSLAELMRAAAIYGTASGNSLTEIGGMGGKTGTSENLPGAECHSWFTGFFPSAKPEYALTVFIEQGGSSQNALKLFDKLANILYEIYPSK